MPQRELLDEGLLGDGQAGDPGTPRLLRGCGRACPGRPDSTSSSSMAPRPAAIPQQFLMPYFNRARTSTAAAFENRARFWIARPSRWCREAVGDTCRSPRGFGIDTLREARRPRHVLRRGPAVHRARSTSVDLWDVLVGSPTVAQWIARPRRDARRTSRALGSRRCQGAHVQADRRRRALHQPRHDGRAIAAVSVDIIGAARPSIADPFLPRKIEEGRLDDIRECIGCKASPRGSTSRPADRLHAERHARRGVPAGLASRTFTRAANADNDVLVIGGGPAGMECARCSASAGCAAVHLVEAEPELGGCMRLDQRRMPGLGEWGRVVNYR